MRRRLRVQKLPILPLVLGVTDGILNALTLAGGAILRGHGDGLNALLALRVGTAALVTAAFTMFVADYAERRSRLRRSSRELNMTEPGRLAATNLGRAIVRESALATVVAGVGESRRCGGATSSWRTSARPVVGDAGDQHRLPWTPGLGACEHARR